MRTADGYIISQCLNGNSAAFGFLVDKYKESVYALAYSMLRDFQDAEDVAQEVFLKAYRKLNTLKRYDRFHAWLFAITSNLCKDWLRSRSRWPDREFIEDQDPEMLERRSMEQYREDSVYMSIREALEALPESYCQALTLQYFSGMKTREIAEFLGTTPDTIKHRLARARAYLKEEMLAMMGTTFESRRLPGGFTFRILEAVKEMKIQPITQTTGLPWGILIVTGLIFMVLSLNPRFSLFSPMIAAVGSPLPVEMEVLKTGEIPVEVLKTSQVLSIGSTQGNDNALANAKMNQNAFAQQTVFKNVAKEAGVDAFLQSVAPVWGDYDNDYDLDLYVTGGNWAGSAMVSDILYRNNGDGTFTDVTEEAGLEKSNGDSKHAGFLDYDNDGYLDLYVSNPNWEANFKAQVLLYHNNGNGTFTEVSEKAGIEDLENFSPAGGFADYDNDGFLDLYLTANWMSNVLYKNNGDGTFTNVAKKAGVENSVDGNGDGGFNFTSGDYDDDGDMDIYLPGGGGGVNGPAVLYRNNGDGTFTDVTKEAGLNAINRGRGSAFIDYDNDGDLDLITVGGTTPLHLYRNNGDGTFNDVAREAKLTTATFERLATGDYDNDGYVDVYLMPWGRTRMLYHNNGDGTFEDVTKEVGVAGQAIKSGGCAFGDYDNDGDLDLYASNLSGFNELFRNEGNDNHWLHIKAVGTKSNRDGVGARVKVQAGELSMIREINSGCSQGHNILAAHFGLGENSVANSIEVRWPSGRMDVMKDIPADQFIVIQEGVGIIKGTAVEPQGKLNTTWGEIKSNRLYQNYPNPFNPETWIPYQLAEDADVEVSIYSNSGELIRSLDIGHKPAGSYAAREEAVHWDGSNDSGEQVASGVYFYAIQAGNFTATKKMAVTR